MASMSRHFSEEARNLFPKEDLETFEAKPWTQLFDCLVVEKEPNVVAMLTEEYLGLPTVYLEMFFL